MSTKTPANTAASRTSTGYNTARRESRGRTSESGHLPSAPPPATAGRLQLDGCSGLAVLLLPFSSSAAAAGGAFLLLRTVKVAFRSCVRFISRHAEKHGATIVLPLGRKRIKVRQLRGFPGGGGVSSNQAVVFKSMSSGMYPVLLFPREDVSAPCVWRVVCHPLFYIEQHARCEASYIALLLHDYRQDRRVPMRRKKALTVFAASA